MSAITPDLMRHALKTAESHQMNEVELQIGESRFRAVLGGVKAPAARPAPVATDGTPAPIVDTTKPIKSTSVGYFRAIAGVLESGNDITVGQVVGSIVALGLTSDIIANIAGKVDQVLVKDGEIVDFGKVIATIEVA